MYNLTIKEMNRCSGGECDCKCARPAVPVPVVPTGLWNQGTRDHSAPQVTSFGRKDSVTACQNHCDSLPGFVFYSCDSFKREFCHCEE